MPSVTRRRVTPVPAAVPAAMRPVGAPLPAAAASAAPRAETLQDYVKSASNVALLTSFATRRLVAQWPLAADRVPAMLELVLPEAIETVMSGPAATWKLTPENIADINTAVWSHVKMTVERLLQGAQVNPETVLEYMFVERRGQDDATEAVLSERTLEHQAEHHRRLWG